VRGGKALGCRKTADLGHTRNGVLTEAGVRKAVCVLLGGCSTHVDGVMAECQHALSMTEDSDLVDGLVNPCIGFMCKEHGEGMQCLAEHM